MHRTSSNSGTRAGLFLCMVIVLAGGPLTGCASRHVSTEQRQEDIKTCSKLGLPYGSQDNYNCMMREQLHRERSGD
jgi:hypothetical protein